MEERSVKKNPFKTIWNILSIPMSVIGLLSLSDSLITFHHEIQNIINSYQSIIYPPFSFMFSWLNFDLPTWIFDYLTLGILFTSCQRKVYGLVNRSKNILALITFNVLGILWSFIIWPWLLISSIIQIKRTDSDGIITSLTKGPNPIYIKYNHRVNDMMVINYILASIVVFIVVLVLNFTYLLN